MKMNTVDAVRIPFSRARIILTIAGSIAFVVLGAWLWSSAGQQSLFPLFMVRFIAALAILFFSATLLYGIRKMTDSRPALIIDEQGILDNSSASSPGFYLSWDQIRGFRQIRVFSTKMILIDVANPDYYAARLQGAPKKMMENNLQIYSAPFVISSTVIAYSIDQLESLLQEKMSIFKK